MQPLILKEEKMQNWIVIEEEYLNYLRKTESRIPISDYGSNKYKPFFGELFSAGDLVYVTQISHAQQRHLALRNSKDFLKIYLPSSTAGASDRLVAVVNLNYMFPISKSIISTLEYKDIDKHRTFTSETEKTQYIDLLRKEMTVINSLDIENKAKSLYDLKIKFPDDAVSKRCLDFSKLEELASQYTVSDNT